MQISYTTMYRIVDRSSATYHVPDTSYMVTYANRDANAYVAQEPKIPSRRP